MYTGLLTAKSAQVREITLNVSQEPMRWTAEALLAIQEVSIPLPHPPAYAGSTSLLATSLVANSLLRLTLLQATEDFMVHLFNDTNLCCIHAKRVTISKCPMPT